jgi:hypothetical protein
MVISNGLMAGFVGLAVALAGSLAIGDQPEKCVLVQPKDTGEALVNPGMGWTLHYYSNYIENYETPR